MTNIINQRTFIYLNEKEKNTFKMWVSGSEEQQYCLINTAKSWTIKHHTLHYFDENNVAQTFFFLNDNEVNNFFQKIAEQKSETEKDCQNFIICGIAFFILCLFTMIGNKDVNLKPNKQVSKQEVVISKQEVNQTPEVRYPDGIKSSMMNLEARLSSAEKEYLSQHEKIMAEDKKAEESNQNVISDNDVMKEIQALKNKK